MDASIGASNESGDLPCSSEETRVFEFESTHQLLGFICWACNSDKTEMTWDAYIPDCQKIMERLEAAETEASQSQSINEHIPVEHALYFITQKCRHLETCQRAIQLMRRAVKVDSSWHVKLLLAACEAHISHEEQGRDTIRGVLDASKRLSWTEYSWNDGGTKIVLSLTSALPDANGKRSTIRMHVHPSQLNAISQSDVSTGN